MGWGITKSPSGRVVYEHSGGSIGGSSQLMVYPETHVVVALVTNLTSREWKASEVEAVAEKFESGKK